MRFTIIGAGAVGAVLGLHLGAAGHEIEYVVRTAHGERTFRLRDARSGATVHEARATVRRAEDAGPLSDVVLVCVRGEQVDDAMRTVAIAAPAAPVVAIAAPVELGDLARLRARHPGVAIVTIEPAFLAWSDTDDAWRWVRPRWLRSVLSHEDDVAARNACRVLARVLGEAGIRARVARSAHAELRSPFSSGLAVLAAWELRGWPDDLLRGEPKLRRRTVHAMREAARAVRAQSRGLAGWVLRWAPRPVLGVLVQLLPHLLSTEQRTMWRQHGPKIAAQTRRMLDEVLVQAREGGVAAPNLQALREGLSELDRGQRWRSGCRKAG
jgi:hypothetical protein